MFRTIPLSVIRIFLLYTQQWYVSYLTACERNQDGKTRTTHTIAVCTVKNS